MTSITDIDIHSARRPEALAELLTTAYKRGWEMYGMLSTTSCSGATGTPQVTYSQMVVKRIKTEDLKPNS